VSLNPPGGDARFAQTFTAQNTGALTAGQIEITKSGSTGDWVLRLQDVDATGTPTNNLLAAETIPDSSVPTGDSLLTANFATPATVTAGQQYAIVLTRPGATSMAVGGRTGDDCPGAFYSSGSQTGAFGLGSPGLDLIFAVFVELPTPPKADRTLALDANKNKVKKRKKVTLSGDVNASGNAGTCEANQTIELQRKKPTQTSFTTFQQLQTDGAGGFSLKTKVKKTFEYRAQVSETATCNGQVSNTEKVKVKKKRKK
jgi:hypothetical protein